MDNPTKVQSLDDASLLKYDGPLLRQSTADEPTMPVFHRVALSVLYDLEDYLDDRSDVIDGDYGQPHPNREMTLLGEVRLAIRLGEKGK